MTGRAIHKQSDRLTARERQVLRALVWGETNEELAERLYVSVSTIRKHTQAIYRKLGVNNRVQAVVRGITTGMITVEELETSPRPGASQRQPSRQRGGHRVD